MPSEMTTNAILTDPVTRAVYATDNSIYQIEPHGVLLPADSSDIAACMQHNAATPKPRPIVARGAGTGTNGQSLTDGIMIDLKRRLNRVISIDEAAATAVVEPGVVTAALNARLSPHGLFWAPHTSTLNRATVGGMIATDAAGKGSLVHGRAHRHVLALDVILDDGTPWRAEAVTIDKATELAGGDDRIARLWRDLLDLPVVENGDYGLPELARGFSGYGIDRVRREGLIDPIPLLCGSEGTLAVIVAATLRLTPIPAHTALVVASYDSFASALDDAIDLASTAPSAIESFDETTLESGRSSPAWPALGQVVGDGGGSVLLLEYTGDSEPDLDPVLHKLSETGRSRAATIVTDPAQRAAAWKVRADAVGLLAKVATGGPALSARPTAFVEDCAVPVAAMPSFIAGFRRVLDSFDLNYAMFGHADVGCVHVRPALDLTDPGHAAMVRTVTDAVVELVAEHGGVLWGEHGRGFRGDPVSSFLSEETIAIMRRVKSVFDPRDLLNPGKLYRPLDVAEEIIALDAVALRGEHNREVPVAVRDAFAPAFACNGNGLCHHYDAAEVMCPSYKATGDPALSPKGRADLLRAWLARPASAAGAEEFEDALADNLHQCLSCSACTGHCPVEVDVPELKSRFLERYYERRRRPLSHHLLGRFERLATISTRVPTPISRLGSRLGGRALGLVDLPVPRPPGRSAKDPAMSFDPGGPPGEFDVVLMPDVFTAALDPTTMTSAVEVLERCGYSVGVAPFVDSGKFDHVKGRRKRFGAAVSAQARMVSAIVAADAVPIVIEPAIALLHRHEYRQWSADHPATEVRYLAEVILERVDRLQTKGEGTTVTLLGHCTERATSPEWLQAWGTVLRAVGYEVATPDLGCCGMAGIFGHEATNQEMSRRLFDLGWSQAVKSTGLVAATGYSCRSQTKRLAAIDVAHPVTLL